MCGKEYIIKTSDDISDLCYATGYDGEIGIGCDCDNNNIEQK